MHGNVCEWCQDWYDKDYYANSDKTDPSGPLKGSYRVHRGGCWRGYGEVCRAACRNFDPPPSRIYYLGFRVALVPTK